MEAAHLEGTLEATEAAVGPQEFRNKEMNVGAPTLGSALGVRRQRRQRMYHAGIWHHKRVANKYVYM
jgi:hypothetical protein